MPQAPDENDEQPLETSPAVDGEQPIEASPAANDELSFEAVPGLAALFEIINSGEGAGVGPTGQPGLKIPPHVFVFRPHPKVENWQETDCVPIIFTSPLGQFPRSLKIGVKVGAPRKLASGKMIGPDEAAQDSSFAAEAAATAITKLLDMGAPTGAIQKSFYQFMQELLDNLRKGFRVNDCSGSV
ncbi:hypothetical protein Rhe02_34430 [Rhizocola hellebori]|uniref:Uncharacterized protein n=2 Tax=Rhizocola hellebori TaxID=1392758 RepID=A0A8J3Q8Z9_9ACTN|nr:hypothetical protein Rhe02_34430 [Rhizocola hellebori]